MHSLSVFQKYNPKIFANFFNITPFFYSSISLDAEYFSFSTIRKLTIAAE